MNVICTKNAPAAVGPYSQAIDCSDLVFLSGQIPLVPETGLVPMAGWKRRHTRCSPISKPFSQRPECRFPTL